MGYLEDEQYRQDGDDYEHIQESDGVDDQEIDNEEPLQFEEYVEPPIDPNEIEQKATDMKNIFSEYNRDQNSGVEEPIEQFVNLEPQQVFIVSLPSLPLVQMYPSPQARFHLSPLPAVLLFSSS